MPAASRRRAASGFSISETCFQSALINAAAADYYCLMIRFRLRVMSCAVLAAVALLIAAPGSGRPAGAGADNTVRLIVDYGDGAAKTVANLPWSKGSTVLDAMKEAATRPHGISFSFTGSGDSATLTKIDDVANGGNGKKNWQYWVNGNYGDRSFATFELQPQDTVVWRFTTEQGR
jgi:hypothetical protein